MIIDWVPAHTSSRHPWFREAQRSREHPRRNRYIWRDPAPGGGLAHLGRRVRQARRRQALTLVRREGRLALRVATPR